MLNQGDKIGWGSPEGEDPTLGSHEDEFTNCQHLALTGKASATQNKTPEHFSNLEIDFVWHQTPLLLSKLET